MVQMSHILSINKFGINFILCDTLAYIRSGDILWHNVTANGVVTSHFLTRMTSQICITISTLVKLVSIIKSGPWHVTFKTFKWTVVVFCIGRCYYSTVCNVKYSCLDHCVNHTLHTMNSTVRRKITTVKYCYWWVWYSCGLTWVTKAIITSNQ